MGRYDPFKTKSKSESPGAIMLKAVKEANERIDRQRQYIKDTITILDNRDDNQNVDDLRALMDEARERLIYYSNGNVN